MVTKRDVADAWDETDISEFQDLLQEWLADNPSPIEQKLVAKGSYIEDMQFFASDCTEEDGTVTAEVRVQYEDVQTTSCSNLEDRETRETTFDVRVDLNSCEIDADLIAWNEPDGDY